jgi:transmembrane sensor
VYLEGQAYFDVKHDSARPFEVRTAAGVARDIGTQFVVRAYPETRGMRVAVAEGVAALGAPSAAPLLTLVEGDLGNLDSAGVATLSRGANLRPYLAWAEGTLVFDGARLGDALTELGRWYDLEIRLADPSLAERRLTATFTNEPAPQVLERIARVLRLEVRQSGRVVTFVAPASARNPS